MVAEVLLTIRVFRTPWFTKAAQKARIKDHELCDAIVQAQNGQAVDLGGGVFKKRLSNNQYRGVILAKGGSCWVFQYLFAKKDRDNLNSSELQIFRELAKAYATLSLSQIAELIRNEDFIEICKKEKP